jgi:hypothetical protein
MTSASSSSAPDNDLYESSLRWLSAGEGPILVFEWDTNNSARIEEFVTEAEFCHFFVNDAVRQREDLKRESYG